jgi:hypothetical protein
MLAVFPRGDEARRIVPGTCKGELKRDEKLTTYD